MRVLNSGSLILELILLPIDCSPYGELGSGGEEEMSRGIFVREAINPFA